MTAPYDMADAYAMASDPARHGCHPALMRWTWAFLKEARGQPVRFDRIGAAAHLIERPNEVDAARVRAQGAIRAAVARVTGRAEA